MTPPETEEWREFWFPGFFSFFFFFLIFFLYLRSGIICGAVQMVSIVQ